MSPDNQNTPQNPIYEESSIPPSPQEPTEQGTENTAHSEPPEASPEAPEAPGDDFQVKSNDIPFPDFTHIEHEKEPETEEKQRGNEFVSEPISEPVQAIEPPDSASSPQATAQIPVIEPLPVITFTKLSQKDLWKRFLDKVQIGKRKKLEKIMTLFIKKSKVTNDEVEKFLHVSDATTTRYLSQLEKEGKIKQTGKTGHSVFYSKI